MLNRKADNVMLAILFLIILELLAYFIPVPSESTQIVKLTYCVAATIISRGLFYCYLRVRNKIFYRKLNEYCNQNDYDGAINLLNKAVAGHPKNPWIRMQRDIFWATHGEFDRYWAEYNLIYNRKPFCKKKYFQFYLLFVVIGDGLDFINDTSTKMKLTTIVDGKPIEKYLILPFIHIHKAIQAYQNNDMKSAVYYAGLLCNERNAFLNLFSSFLLMKAYENLGEMEKSVTYKTMYLSNPINPNRYNK
ncbi:MAG: hypothetical protein HFG28_08615 [Eubacterium sp.]|nr:hypothetical protein [Eubacterium sp.]